MIFNQCIGPEELCKEYKEFTFNIAGLPLDLYDCESYCLSNIFDFNEIVLNNLNKYFRVYLPKYVSSFLNLNYSCKFYIGINDLGYVKGIPFKGELPIKTLCHEMYKIIYNNIKADNNIDFSDFIKINFIKVNFNKEVNNTHEKFINYLIQKNKFYNEYKKFIKSYETWKDKLLFINKKLVDLVNSPDTRVLLINYIKSLDPTNPVINLLLSDYKLESKSHEELLSLKDKSNNVYYWVTRWKDEYRRYIISIKPTFNIEFSLKNIPYNLIQGVSDMIPYWMNYNDNMNLYVISVDIIKNNIPHKYKFYDNVMKKWLYCERKIFLNQPVCLLKKI